MWFLHNPGILGINARNLLYIRAYNPEKAILLADSKLKTKHYLSTRGIPTAKLYATIGNREELKKFNWFKLPDAFVIKPNSGFGGEGIIIIQGRKGTAFIDSTGKLLTLQNLCRHAHDILDGRYSIMDLPDKVLFEQRLEAPYPFNKMAVNGLPDIRIVVHNLIPVMAMLRLPTDVSQGKANVHRGGIAVGIDIATGELTYATQYNKRIKGVPGFGEVEGIKIPAWETILLIASKTQHITNLGFAAVDLTLDKEMGPLLLEINARSGLAVQIANMAPLHRRLQRIEGIKVGSPEKGVRIAQEIFGHKTSANKKEEIKKIVIGQWEPIEVIGKEENAKILAFIDPNNPKTILDESLSQVTGLDRGGKCRFNLMGKKITTGVITQNLHDKPYKMIIGKRDLGDFLIDPQKPMPTALASDLKTQTPVIKKKFTEEELQKIDQEIVEMDSSIHLLAHLRPLNLKEVHAAFLRDSTKNPLFEYKPFSFDPKHLTARLKRLEFPDSPMGILWKKKVDSIYSKIALLEVRGTSFFTEYSTQFYGAPDQTLLNQALKEVNLMPQTFPTPEKILTAREAAKVFEQVIEEVGLTGWRVQLKEDLVSDAVAGKQNTVLIRKGATFSAERLKGTIAHEIETHVFTAMNGSFQPYKIFQRGLAGYLLTEEGLAVYNQERTEAKTTVKHYWPASSVIGIAKALQGSFVEVYQEVMKYGFNAERAWQVALKAKRGLTDTSFPGAFTKDVVYFKGFRLIQDFVAKGGDLRDLYVGKINLDDLPLIKKIPGLKKPLYLPRYLQQK